MTKLLFTTLIVLLALFASSTPIKAQEYIVQPILVIPSDWESRTSPERIENEFNPNIFGALKDVQEFYKQRLNGKTFRFSTNLHIVRSKETAGEAKHLKSFRGAVGILSLYQKLSGNRLLVDNEKAVSLLWIVGSEDAVEIGGYTYLDENQNKKVRAAWMSNDNLLKISKKRDPRERNMALGVLAHELGHAFDLVLDGRARWHPCSEVSTDECLGPPPYPERDEFYDNVMGAWWLYPSTGFTNTISNPVIRKAFLSPFLNPQREPGPIPIKPPAKVIEVTKISPDPIKPGNTLQIEGRGFGDNKGQIILSRFHKDSNIKPEVIQWNDNKITISIPDTGIQYRAIWDLQIITSKTRWTGNITIEATTSPPTTLIVNLSTTCGEDKKALPNVKATLVGLRGFQNVASVLTETNGKGILGYTITQPSLDETFYDIVPDPIDGILPTESKKPIVIPDITKLTTRDVSFHYPVCPASLSPSLTPSPTPTPVDDLPETDDETLVPGRTCLNEFKYNECIGCNKSQPAYQDTCTGEWSTGEEQENFECASYCEEQKDNETSEQQATITNMLISNYDDFRDANPLGDEKSSTTTSFSPPAEGTTHIDWKLSTVLPDKKLYARKFLSDNTYKDVEVTVDHNQTVDLEFLEIAATTPRKVVRIMINGEDVDIDNPTKSVRLPGIEDQPQQFIIPILVEYSTEEVVGADLTVNYNPNNVTSNQGQTAEPETSEPSETQTENQEDGEVNQPDTEPELNQKEEPGCVDQFKWNECIGCNTSQPAYQNTCTGEWSTGPAQEDAVCDSYCTVTCDNVYYWEPNANDGAGTCINTDASPPDCIAYNFEHVDP